MFYNLIYLRYSTAQILKYFISYKNSFAYKPVILLFSVIIAASCTPTKYVPQGETLLDKSEIKIADVGMKRSDLLPYIKQVPNKKIFGARFHLGLYNLSNLDKEGWPNGWLRKIGEEPVIFDPFATTKSAEQIDNYLFYKGFFNAEVNADLFTRKKKTSVTYNIIPKQPYILDRIQYQVEDTTIRKLIYLDTINCMFESGQRYDIDAIEGEMMRVERFVKDLGYYNFSRDNIKFVGDTMIGDHKVNLDFRVSNYRKIGYNGIITFQPHQRYRIRDIYIYADFDPKASLSGGESYFSSLDTIEYKGFYFIDNRDVPVVKYDVILQTLYIKPGDLYQVTNMERSLNHLNSLKAFRLVNINYNEPGETYRSTRGEQFLDCNIQLTPVMQQAFTVELEGTHSAGNLGGAINFIYQHRNLFRGAEQLNMKLKGAYETLTSSLSGSRSTQEYGFETSLSFPRFLLPFLETESFIKKYNPKTVLKVAYNYQKMPVYTRTVADATFGYNWKSNSFSTHSVNPLQFNIVKLPYIDAAFEARIDTSSYLAYSYKDIFIAGGNYTYVFNNQNINKARDYWYLKFNGELAGNLLSLGHVIAGDERTDGSYSVLGQPFAQYIKGDIDLRYNRTLNEASRIVYRLFLGVGLPYGNSRAIPFEKQYFGGGANGIRAWQVRSLGPGSYVSEETAFYNQTADIKIELNTEYRFKLFWILEGAVFIDAGNIWTLYTDEDRPGSKFEFGKFYKDFAIGSGFGLRFDLNFITLRTDLGLKIRDPQVASGTTWIPGSRPLSWRDDFTLSFSIGYPF